MPEDQAELVKAGAQGIVEGAMKPFSDLLLALLGPAASEAGLMLKDSVQHYRQMRRIRFFERTREILDEAQIRPGPVSLKILLPIIENATNEEDDDLQDRWATLLANSANPAYASKVHPSFPAILKELTARDVKFLDTIFDWASSMRGNSLDSRIEDVSFNYKTVMHIFRSAGLERDDGPKMETIKANIRARNLSIDTFERNGILARDYGVAGRSKEGEVDVGSVMRFTDLGVCFVCACRNP